MAAPLLAPLPDRGIVAVAGDDAEKLLQGVITNDMQALREWRPIHAALLSPQGKILFEFIVARTAGGYLLDVARDKAAELARRLTMYKLRARAEVRDASAEYGVHAAWRPDGAAIPAPDEALVAGFTGLQIIDPRLPALGLRLISRLGDNTALDHASGPARATAADYHAHRIALGVPEGGKDYAFGDAFPHEALFDQLHGVSFTKGCYVGQEIVSRMEHRGTTRKRIVPVVASRPLPATGTEIRAGEVALGMLGSTAGERGLALIRLDRAAEMIAKREPMRAGVVEIHIELPAFATFKIETKSGEAAGT